ncbi:MAG: sigma-70 family RNA polymerase sigma factor [Pirellulaceae bacterium]|nr:sigma-70 family RNA polymerase sigma factor [Pirellulaceae bacterium]
MSGFAKPPSATDTSGQDSAQLFASVYDELRKMAAGRLALEPSGQTLQPTALVHEVYLRLLATTDGANPPWESRGHFFTAAATAMRRILIETARRKSRQKHGGGRCRVDLDPEQIADMELADELLALDEALARFAAVEPKIAELVMLRYFGGLTIREAAAALEIAPRTADAHWAYARAWLQAECNRHAGDT